MNRRRFFQSIARAAAIIGLAPVIAFRAPKLDWGLPDPTEQTMQLDWEEWLELNYKIKRARECDEGREIQFLFPSVDSARKFKELFSCEV